MLPLRPARRLSRLSRCSKRELSLAYDLHKPRKPEPGHAPLIILHGLFGSKQNNRSISKYGFSHPAFKVRILIGVGHLHEISKRQCMRLSVFIWQRRNHRLLIFIQDLRNHGNSPHDPEHDYSAMADDVEEFIQQRDLRLPTLIGHSMLASSFCVRSWTKLNSSKGRKSSNDCGIAVSSTRGSFDSC